MLFWLFACAVGFWFDFVAKVCGFRLLFNIMLCLFLLIKVSFVCWICDVVYFDLDIVIYWLAHLRVVFCCYDETSGLFYCWFW